MPVRCARCQEIAFTVTADHGPLCREHYRAARSQSSQKVAVFQEASCHGCGKPMLLRRDSDSPAPYRRPSCQAPYDGGAAADGDRMDR